MLNGNLSTRPFYNERLASLAIAAIAVVAILLTIFNLSRLVTLSAQRAEFSGRIAQDYAEAERVRTETAALQQRVDRTTLAVLAGSTREANTLIDQRTFSWTAFFSLLERTLPVDVRLVAVAPRVERGVFKVVMTVVSRSFTDIDEFVDALLATGAFYDVAPTNQQTRADGAYNATIEASYLSPRPAADSPQEAR